MSSDKLVAVAIGGIRYHELIRGGYRTHHYDQDASVAWMEPPPAPPTRPTKAQLIIDRLRGLILNQAEADEIIEYVKTRVRL